MALIGYDARILYRSIPGGIGNYLRHLTSGLLSASDHRVRLYHNTPGWPLPVQAQERLAECCAPDRLGRLRWWEQQTLPQLARRDRLDLLHCPFNTLPFRQPCPTVVTIHDTILAQLDIERRTVAPAGHVLEIVPDIVRSRTHAHLPLPPPILRREH